MTPSGLAASFQGHVVAVTGAATGIGRAVACRFAALGAHVALIDCDETRLHDTAQRITAQGWQAAPFTGSVADAVARQCGPASVLVNNAGILLRGTLDSESAEADMRRTFDVNVGGLFNAACAFLPQLRQRRGCIVNLASIHAFVAVRNSVAYTASKGAVKQMTQALALELGEEGIRVNAVAPGLTATDMTHDTCSTPEKLADFLQRVPLARAGTVDDIANAVQFLASEAAAYITGVTLPVDGGYTAA
jgi:meso-butanediol dehydrogenase/(S,S)-butanediol dehydrogenase/diacetyl reductase